MEVGERRNTTLGSLSVYKAMERERERNKEDCVVSCERNGFFFLFCRWIYFICWEVECIHIVSYKYKYEMACGGGGVKWLVVCLRWCLGFILFYFLLCTFTFTFQDSKKSIVSHANRGTRIIIAAWEISDSLFFFANLCESEAKLNWSK